MMKNHTLQDFLDLHGRCILAGKFNAILAMYQEVLPFYLDGKAILIDGHDELRSALHSFRERLIEDDVRLIKGTVLDGHLKDTGRFSMKIRWDYYTQNSKLSRDSVARYFCVNEPAGIKIEMVEYQRFAYSDFDGWSRFDPSALHAAAIPPSRVLH